MTRRSPQLAPLKAIAAWPLWALPTAVRAYVTGLIAVWLGGLVVAVAFGSADLRDVTLFALLLGCAAITVESGRRHGEPTGFNKDMLSAWWIPMALALPPAFVMAAPLPIMLMVQYRIRRGVLHRRVFTAAAVGLAYGSASLAFHTAPSGGELSLGPTAVFWIASALIAALLGTLLNNVLVAGVVKLVAPSERWRNLLLTREQALLDVGEGCTGVLVGLASAVYAPVAAVAVVPVLLLQRATLHEQLTAAARTDAKTGLLNGPAWEREAELEIARAGRTTTPLSVMLVDLDHFKQVNDTHGHLVGDQVLAAVSQVLTAQTREYDRCGRFGGDEFAILLPQSDTAEAVRTAERIRSHIQAIAIPVDDDTVARVGVSIGIAGLTSADQDVTDLLAAADVSLYHAKDAGRGCIRTSPGSHPR